MTDNELIMAGQAWEKSYRDANAMLGKVMVEKYPYIDDLIADAKAEAIKEFAERLKEKHRRITDYDEAGFGCQIFVVEESYIDNLVKEMVGDAE